MNGRRRVHVRLGQDHSAQNEIAVRVAIVLEHHAGIGVALAVRDHAVKIMTVLPNTPAAKAGLSVGLIVPKIDGTPTDDTHLKDWVEKLRGDAGTKVKLELVDAANGKTNTVELIREQIKL